MVLCLKTWESRSPPSLEVLLAICMDRELSSLLHSWLESLRLVDSRSFATVVAYDGDVASFLQFYQTTYQVAPSLDSLISVQSRDWRAWLADQKSKGLSPKTLARRLSALKSFYLFLVQKGIIEDHPILAACRPRIPRSLPRPASGDAIGEMRELIRHEKTFEWVQLRDEALLLLLYGAGLRINEALAFNGQDWTEDYLAVYGKGGKFRQVPILEPVREQMAKYRHGCPYNTEGRYPLFVGVKGKRLMAQVYEARVRRWRRQLGLSEDLTPHALRHSCATHLLTQSGDLRGIQELLGHASLSTTQIYADLNDDSLYEIYQQAHPREDRKTNKKCE